MRVCHLGSVTNLEQEGRGWSLGSTGSSQKGSVGGDVAHLVSATCPAGSKRRGTRANGKDAPAFGNQDPLLHRVVQHWAHPTCCFSIPWRSQFLASLTWLSAPLPSPPLGLAVLQHLGQLLLGSISPVKAEHVNAAVVERTVYLWVIAARALGWRPVMCILRCPPLGMSHLWRPYLTRFFLHSRSGASTSLSIRPGAWCDTCPLCSSLLFLPGGGGGEGSRGGPVVTTAWG